MLLPSFAMPLEFLELIAQHKLALQSTSRELKFVVKDASVLPNVIEAIAEKLDELAIALQKDICLADHTGHETRWPWVSSLGATAAASSSRPTGGLGLLFREP